MYFFMNLFSVFLGFFSIFFPNLIYFIFYNIFIKNCFYSAKKILLFLYSFELLKIVLFVVLCIFVFKYVKLNELLYFISLCFFQILLFIITIKMTFK